MGKTKTLSEDHALHNDKLTIHDPKRSNPLQKLLSPAIAIALLVTGALNPAPTPQPDWTKTLKPANTPTENITSTLPTTQLHLNKQAELDAIGGKNKPGKLLTQGGDPKKGIVITIHGVNDTPASVLPLGNNATKTGAALKTFAWDDRSRRLHDSADDFGQALQKLIQKNPNAPIIINAHSMGGRVAAVGLSRLEKTGELQGKNIQLNLVAPPLEGVKSANMSWMGAGIAPSIRFSLDMGTESKFQKELENIQFQNVKTQVYGADNDSIAIPNPNWKQLATQLSNGKAPVILQNTDHNSAIQNVARVLANPHLQNTQQTPTQTKNLNTPINLPKEWEPHLKNLHSQSGTQPSKQDLIEFHRKTQIQAEVQDATQFLQEYRNIPKNSPEAETLKLQTEMEMEQIWKNSNYNIPPERERDILNSLQTLNKNKKLNLVGQDPTNQTPDTHRERLAVARDLSPGFDPFNGKEEIQQSLKTKTQTTTNPTNIGTPTKNVIVIGEKHHDSKNSELYPALLDRLHQKGFRTLSLELPENLKRIPLDTLTQTLNQTPSTIQKDILKEEFIQKQGLSKEWIDTYSKAKSLGWQIHFTDKPSEQISKDIAEFESAKETLGNGATLSKKTAKNIENQKDNLAGLPHNTWATLNQLENSHIEARSKHIAQNLTNLPGKILHIGGALHTSEVQDTYAQLTGKRPLGLQIQYQTSSNPLQKLTNPSAEDKMEKHLDINKRSARHSKNCFELPHEPNKALKVLEKLTHQKDKTLQSLQM